RGRRQARQTRAPCTFTRRQAAMKTRFGMIILALALVAPLPAFAHEGHEHKLMGTIKAVDATHLVLVTTDAKTHQEKTVNVAFNAKTKFRRGEDTLDRGALK